MGTHLKCACVVMHSSEQEININILGYLKDLIEEHLQMFKNVFNEDINPKQHYVVYLPSQILKFGPLVRVWSRCFKAKHQQFKLIPKLTKNVCHLPKTLAERHQSEVRAHSISLSAADNPPDHCLFRKDFVYGESSSHVRALDQHDKDAAKDYILRFYPSFEDESDKPIYQDSSLTVHGTCYKKGNNTMPLAEMSDSNHVFGSLENIWPCDLFVFLSLKLYETLGFGPNLLSY